MLKNPSYSGITTEFWNSCDAICSRDHWTLWGTPNCGKGQPMQTMGTGHGASPSRFRNVKRRRRVRQSDESDFSATNPPSQTRRDKRQAAASATVRKKPATARGAQPASALRCGAAAHRREAFSISATRTKPKWKSTPASDALTRFANNTIHQNVAEQTLTVSVRTVLRRPHRARHHQQDR